MNRTWARFLVLVSALFLCVGSAAAAQTDDSGYQLHPLLYRFEKNGISFHVLGSIHSVGARYFPQWLFDEVASSSRVVLEVADVKLEKSDRDLQLADGVLLSQLISPEAWKKLTAELEKELDPKTGLATLEKMKPEVVYFILEGYRKNKSLVESERIQKMAQFTQAVSGAMDVELRDFAKAKKIPIGALETTAAQLKSFSVTPQVLQDYILTPQEFTNLTVEMALIELTRLVIGYFDGDFRPMIRSTRALDEDAYYALFTARNFSWMKQLNSSPNKSFYIVGAGHLLGPTGIRQLLRASGWKSTIVRQCDAYLNPVKIP